MTRCFLCGDAKKDGTMEDRLAVFYGFDGKE